jgi:hypothetical protein
MGVYLLLEQGEAWLGLPKPGGPERILREQGESWRDFGRRLGHALKPAGLKKQSLPVFLGSSLVLAESLRVGRHQRKGSQWLPYVVEELVPWDAENLAAAGVPGTEEDRLLAVVCDGSLLDEFCVGLEHAPVVFAPASLVTAQAIAKETGHRDFDCFLSLGDQIELARFTRGRLEFWWGPASSREEISQRMSAAGVVPQGVAIQVFARRVDAASTSEGVEMEGASPEPTRHSQERLLDSAATLIQKKRLQPLGRLTGPSERTAHAATGTAHKLELICLALLVCSLFFAAAFMTRSTMLKRAADQLGQESVLAAQKTLGSNRVRSPLRALKAETARLAQAEEALRQVGSNERVVDLLYDFLVLISQSGEINASEIALQENRIGLNAKVASTAVLDKLTLLFRDRGYLVDQIKYGAEFEVFLERLSSELSQARSGDSR